MKKHAALIALTISAIVGGFATAANAQTSSLTLSRSLTVGSNGSDVSSLQRFLKDTSFFAYPTVTGHFGPVTKDAVMAFQRAFGIDPVGIVGPATRAKIAALTELATTTVATSSVAALPMRHRGKPAPEYAPPHTGAASDVTPPTLSIISPTGGFVRGTILVAADASDDSSGVEGVYFSLDGSGIGTDPSSPYSLSYDTTLVPDGSHTFAAYARDRAGNVGPTDDSVVSIDNTAPGAPTNLATSSVTQTSLSLSWTASADAPFNEVDYLVERCSGDSCASFVQIATSSSASFDDSGLVAHTFYRYRVRAIDRAGNLSDYSPIADATTLSATYALTVSLGGDGSVASSPAGINCGATCSADYNPGTIVILTATPTIDSFFAGWFGACTGTGACVVTMNRAKSVTAIFISPS